MFLLEVFYLKLTFIFDKYIECKRYYLNKDNLTYKFF